MMSLLALLATHRRAAFAVLLGLVAACVVAGAIHQVHARDARIRAEGERAAEIRLAPVIVRAELQAAEALTRERTAAAAYADSLAAHARTGAASIEREATQLERETDAVRISDAPTLPPLPGVAVTDTVAYADVHRRSDSTTYRVPKFVTNLVLRQRVLLDSSRAVIRVQGATIDRLYAVQRMDSGAVAIRDAVIARQAGELTRAARRPTLGARLWRAGRWVAVGAVLGGAAAAAAGG